MFLFYYFKDKYIYSPPRPQTQRNPTKPKPSLHRRRYRHSVAFLADCLFGRLYRIQLTLTFVSKAAMPTLLTSSNSVYAGHADHADNDDDSATWAEIMGAIGAEADVKASGQVTEPLRKKQCMAWHACRECRSKWSSGRRQAMHAKCVACLCTE